MRNAVSDIPDAVVVGGGLAGTAAAEALQRRGLRVVLIEKSSALASEASGQAGALAQPILHAKATVKMRLSHLAFLYLKKHLENLEKKGHDVLPKECGVLQLAHKPSLEDRFKKAAALNVLSFFSSSSFVHAKYIDDPRKIKEVCGLFCRNGGVFFPQAVWLSPRKLCRAHISHAQIQIILEKRALHFFYAPKEKLWHVQVEKEKTLVKAPYLIIACASETKKFSGLERLPLRRVRGQSLLLPASIVPPCLQCAVAYDGCIIPRVNTEGDCLLGASFEEWNTDKLADPKQNVSLYHKVLHRIPEWESICPPQASNCIERLSTRVAFRTSTPDRLPICGRLPRLRGKPAPNFYINTAFGSHGLLFAPLAAEWTAAQICQEDWSLIIEEDIAQAVSPERYIRDDL